MGQFDKIKKSIKAMNVNQLHSTLMWISIAFNIGLINEMEGSMLLNMIEEKLFLDEIKEKIENKSKILLN